jgi:hypothetical protein
MSYVYANWRALSQELDERYSEDNSDWADEDRRLRDEAGRRYLALGLG